jgi:hypothetical protein
MIRVHFYRQTFQIDPVIVLRLPYLRTLLAFSTDSNHLTLNLTRLTNISLLLKEGFALTLKGWPTLEEFRMA